MKLNFRNKIIATLFLFSIGLTFLFQNCSNRDFSSQDGVLTSSSLSANSAMNCSVNGQTVAENDSRMFFLSSSVPYGSTCQYENRVCTQGYFTGTYQYSTCAAGVAASCLYNGTTIPNGGSVTSYQASTVAFGQSCVPQQRTCNNGVLSGSYEYSSCGVGQPTSCLFNGSTIAHGASVIAYTSSTVNYGLTCSSQIRTCSNGVLSGSNIYPTCAPNAAAACIFNNAVVQHNTYVYGYSTQHVSIYSSATCASYRQSRYCSNGVLLGSNTYQYSTCVKN